MPRQVKISGDGVEAIFAVEHRVASDELWSRLSFETKTKVEGAELRFEVIVPSSVEPADRDELGEGDVAYLPQENALCVFLGPVDEARSDRFTRVGRVTDGLESLRGVKTLQRLRLEVAE